MKSWTETDRRIGKWSAVAVVVLGVVYIITGVIGVVFNTDTAKFQSLQQVDPFLAILEVLMLLVNPAMITLFAAIHAYAPHDKKTYSLAAFGFAVLLVAITGVVHFVQLTVVRRGANAVVAEVFGFYHSQEGRHTAMFAAEMLGWDFFFGFAMLFAAPVFAGDRLQNLIRFSLFISGLLCLIGFSGPASGDMRFQTVAILGYAFGFPFVCLLLAILFSRSIECAGQNTER